MSKDAWYFAYGSNMSMKRKEGRTSPIRQAVRCRLPGHRLTFNKRHQRYAVSANIVADDDEEVWGVIYLCDEETMQELDECEGVRGRHYNRAKVNVLTGSGETIEAVTYIAGEDFLCDEAQPHNEYLQLILDGARDHDLPEWYVEQIKQIATGTNG